MITQSELQTRLEYNTTTGIWYWKTVIPNSRAMVGSQAGFNLNGYKAVKLGGKIYYTHRLAFLYVTGDMPKYVDHINGDRADNRWDNLRVATVTENNRNRTVTKKSQSGVTGVTWNQKQGQWVARITIDRQPINLGSFDNVKEAAKVATEARTKAYGIFHRKR